MTILEAIILGLLQGITEFLPISSSGHLVLAETLLKLDVENLKSFDVAMHMASLFAILFFFRKDIIEILTKKREYILWLVIGTIPAVAAGLLLEDKIDEIFRGMQAVGIVMIITGIYFLFAEKIKMPKGKLSAKNAILIGIAQAVALIPGISRSGSTTATGVILGLERTTAAKFSFLLGSIAILGAGVLEAKDLTSLDMGLDPIIAGFLVSLFASYFAIKFLMKFYQKNTLRPFAYYLFAVGILAMGIGMS